MALQPSRAATGVITAVSLSTEHVFSKQNAASIWLRAGQGVEGDTHAGALVQHRSRVAADPSQPNLRQVHLMHAELHDELQAKGFLVQAGDLGENITTRGLDLLGLPRGTHLHLDSTAVVEVTGLRNPCAQIEAFQKGLLGQVLVRDADGKLVRKAGIMTIVVADGEVRPGDAVRVELFQGEWQPLAVV